MVFRRWVAGSLVTAVAVLCVPSAGSAAPGDLDPSFGDSGVAKLPALRSVESVSLSSDGVYAGGYHLSQENRIDYSAIARLDQSGQPVESFGDRGVVRLDDGLYLKTIAADPEGGVYARASTDGWESAVLLDFGPDGRLDPSFGEAGVVELPDGYGALGPIVDSKGRVLITANNDYIYRFLPDGTPDPSFGAAGSVERGPDGPVAMDVGRDDSIYLAETAPNGTYGVTKLNDSGELVSSYGEGGTAPRALGDAGWGTLALEAGPTGNVSLVGDINDYIFDAPDLYALNRLDTDGDPVPAFSQPLDPGIEVDLDAIAIDGSDTTFAAGYDYFNEYTSAAAIRAIKPSGQPLRSFGSKGTAFASSGLNSLFFWDIDTAADNSLVAGGSVSVGPDGVQAAVARFLRRGDRRPPDLDADGIGDHGDRCPIRQGKRSRHGCPKTGPRSLKAKGVAGPAIYVKVSSRISGCTDGVQLRFVSDKGKTVQRKRTNHRGFVFFNPEPLTVGREYHAAVSRSLGHGDGICPKARSNSVLIR